MQLCCQLKCVYALIIKKIVLPIILNVKMLFNILPWISCKDIGWSKGLWDRALFQVSFKTVAKTWSMGLCVWLELWPSPKLGPGSRPILPGHIHYLFTPAGRAYNVFISSNFSFSSNTVILATLGGGLSYLTRGGLGHGQDQGAGRMGPWTGWEDSWRP